MTTPVSLRFTVGLLIGLACVSGFSIEVGDQQRPEYKTEYVCPPCDDCPQDLEAYDAPGKCPACGKALVVAGSPESRKKTGLPYLYDVQFTKITENVYMAMRPDPLRLSVAGNVTFVINEHDVVVVDAGGAPGMANRIIDEIKRLTPNPVSVLINTHDHTDHTAGNAEFLKAFPALQIVGHKGTRAALQVLTSPSNVTTSVKRVRGIGVAAIKAVKESNPPGADKIVANLEAFHKADIFDRQTEARQIKVVSPNVTIENSITLHRGKRTIQVLFLGAGDTKNDIVVYLPREKVVCAGDMVVSPAPFGFSGQPIEWMETLKRLQTLDYEYLVPGHGDLQRGKSYVQLLLTSLQAIHDSVKAALEKGVKDQDLRAHVDFSMAAEFTKGDPVAAYYFNEYFANPILGGMAADIRKQRKAKEKAQGNLP